MKNKKTIITFILIALLLIVAIIVNIIALNGKNKIAKSKEENVILSTETENKVENDIITEEDLELRGDKFVGSVVKDVNDNQIILEPKEDIPMVVILTDFSNEQSAQVLKISQTYYESYKEKVEFTCVVVNQQIEKVEKYINENNISIPVVYDTKESALVLENDITNFPTILMINKNGEIINTLTSEINDDIIEANLDILSENY